MQTSERKNHRERVIRNRLRLGLLGISLLVPLATFVGFGIYAIAQLEQRWWIYGLIALASSFCAVGYRLLAQNNQTVLESPAEEKPSGANAWSPQEQLIWEKSKAEALRRLDIAADYSSLFQHHPLALADFIAFEYGQKSKFDLTAIEVLTLGEEVSRRYRKLLQERFPFIDQLTIHQIQKVIAFSNSEWMQLAKTAIPAANDLRKAVFNPAGKAVDLIFGEVLSKVGQEALEAAERQMKRLFLYECIGVFMDLYSGRFSTPAQELDSSLEFAEDTADLVGKLEPLRIVFVGQVSAGKSTLVNLLTDEIVAEVDPLPVTDKKMVYETELGSGIRVRLCDMPGLDGSDETVEQVFYEAINADLIIWVLRATQSARDLDAELASRIDDYFGQAINVSLKPPKQLAVMSHLDSLLSNNAGVNDNPSLKDAALQYNRELLKPDAIFPIGSDIPNELVPIQDFVCETLAESIQVQLNRRRKDATKNRLDIQIARFTAGAKALTRAMFRR